MRRVRLGVIAVALALAGCGRSSVGTTATVVSLRSAEVPPRAAFVAPGSLEAKTEAGKRRLVLEKLLIAATIRGDVAETTVAHVFRSESDVVEEGTFRFPMPDGAILTGLAMEIDGKLMEGELVEREKARKAYENIVDQMLDPALLEWESGQTFKLRVFPIEPKKSKRVVLRFVTPLHRSDAGQFYAIHAPASNSDLRPEKVTVTVDGRVIALEAGKDTVVRVADPMPDVVVQSTTTGTYFDAAVRPDLASFPAPGTPARGQAVIVLCDRSRSMLEARALQVGTVGTLLDRLTPSDRFTLRTGDVGVRSLGALRAMTAQGKTEALAFLEATEPDGASDVGKLLVSATEAIREARGHGLDPVVVYVGDATATWGETRAGELSRLAAALGATVHVVSLGASSDEESARALATGGRGRLLRPKTEAEAGRAMESVLAARSRRRIEGLHLAGADGLTLASPVPEVLYEGDAMEIALRTPAVKDAPRPTLHLLGTVAGKPFDRAIELGKAAPAGHVATRWAKAFIEHAEGEPKKDKDAIVATSLEYGVMSRYTSFLVLDSEEAYARFQIERRAKARRDAEARVSGQDLDGADRAASVSPDHLQPGDPEVRIPAPADARSVVVIYPFGETKTATWEPDEAGRGGHWVSRFLVDRATPDGTYTITVRITHADGRVELLELPYVVDTKQPSFDVTVMRRAAGFEIRAKQRLTDAEVLAQTPALGTIDERRTRFAHVLTDAKRMEVETPDGQTIALVHVRLGEFVGTWTASATPKPGSTLRIVAVDRALNESVMSVAVPR